MSAPPPIEWAARSRAIEGEAISGDAFVVEAFEGGALTAVVDGLGHGPQAAEAAQLASEALRAAPSAGVVDLVHRCHEVLARSRGAVLSLASFDARAHTMTWTGVGNVQALLLRFSLEARPAREALLVHGGVVGARLPSVRAATLPVATGDLVLFASDGIRSGFATGIPVADPIDAIAQSVLDRFGLSTDDALVLAVRYRGGVA